MNRCGKALWRAEQILADARAKAARITKHKEAVAARAKAADAALKDQQDKYLTMLANRARREAEGVAFEESKRRLAVEEKHRLRLAVEEKHREMEERFRLRREADDAYYEAILKRGK
jgi:hypothetical protein